jgi:hypothetical protein
VQDAHPAVGELADRLGVGLAAPPQGIVVAPRPGLAVSELKDQRWQASARRRLRAPPVRTIRLRPEARVIGAVPA